jgi:hypothetical protein
VKWRDDSGGLAGDFAGWSGTVKHMVTAKQTIKLKDKIKRKRNNYKIK